MAEDSTVEQINRVIEQLPQLTDFGFGVGGGHRIRPPDEVARDFATNRGLMFKPRSLEQFERACGWWGRQRRVQRINPGAGLKHRAAKSIGYVTNGMFIAAACASGFRVQRISTTPNAWFNLSRKLAD
jgi:hypothetical protein